VVEADRVALRFVELPADGPVWLYVRLGDYCDKIGSGSTPKGGKEAYLSHGPYRLIRSQNIYNDGFKYGGLAYISDEQAKKLDGVAVNAGDVLLNITGDSVARVCSAPSDVLPARVNQHVAIIRPSPIAFDARFVRYYLATPQQQDLLLGMASSGATRDALTKGMIESLRIPQPSLDEQKAIADVLASFDDRIVLLRETNATLEAIAQALFKSWFVNFDPVRAKAEGQEPEGVPPEIAELFPSEFEDSELGEIPKGWTVGRLGDLVGLRNERTKPSPITEQRPYVPIECISSKSIFLAESKSGIEAQSSLITFHRGDIVFGAMRPYFHKVCLAPFDGTTRTTAFVLAPRKAGQTNYCLFQLFANETIEFATNHSEGSTIPYAKWNGSLDKMPIVIPPDTLVEHYSSLVDSFITRGIENMKQERVLSEARDLLLPRLMSGMLSAEHEDVGA
jgi:type I restriction enzyme S subunit